MIYLRCWNLDFSERVGEEATLSLSQEDLQFLTKLKDGIKHK